MSLPELTIFREIASYINDVKTAIAGLSLSASQTSNISIAFSGAAIFDEILIPMASHTVAGTDKVAIAYKTIIRRTSDNEIEIQDDIMLAGSPNHVLYNDGTNRVDLITSGGYFYVMQVSGTAQLQCTVLFYTQPGTKTGIVGPSGSDGRDGEAWGDWVNITLSTGYENAVGAEPSRYRLSNQNCQLQMLVAATAGSWSGTATVATLPAEARPTRNARFPVTIANTVYSCVLSPAGEVKIFSTSEPTDLDLKIQQIYSLD